MKNISDDKFGVSYKDTATGKYGLEIFTHLTASATATVLGQSDHEITCFATSKDFLLVGTAKPELLIYTLGSYDAPAENGSFSLL